jgi:putative membrane protein
MIAAAVFGIFNAFIGILGAPIALVFKVLSFPIDFLTLGLFNFVTFGFISLVLNAMLFGLASSFVDGFELRLGLWSVVWGSVALGVVNSVISGFVSNWLY